MTLSFEIIFAFSPVTLISLNCICIIKYKLFALQPLHLLRFAPYSLIFPALYKLCWNSAREHMMIYYTMITWLAHSLLFFPRSVQRFREARSLCPFPSRPPRFSVLVCAKWAFELDYQRGRNTNGNSTECRTCVGGSATCKARIIIANCTVRLPNGHRVNFVFPHTQVIANISEHFRQTTVHNNSELDAIRNQERGTRHGQRGSGALYSFFSKLGLWRREKSKCLK